MNQLTVIERAVVALGSREYEKALVELAAKSADLIEITNEDSYRQIHGARMALKNARVELEKRAKAARQDATDFSKACIQEEKRLIGITEPEERRLQSIQDAHDAAEENARQERILAEQLRVETIQDRLAEIRGVIQVCERWDCSASLIAEHMGDIERISIDEHTFQEFLPQAQDAKIATLTKLRDIHAAAVLREEEKAIAARQREELDKLRAEQAARELKERTEREARERAERQEREAREATERAAREAAQAERDREQAERDRVQREAQAKIDQENKRLADERAAFERQQAEAKRKEEEAARIRQANEAAARAAAEKSKYPGDRAVIKVLMKHFEVSEKVIRGWLIQLKEVA